MYSIDTTRYILDPNLNPHYCSKHGYHEDVAIQITQDLGLEYIFYKKYNDTVSVLGFLVCLGYTIVNELYPEVFVTYCSDVLGEEQIKKIKTDMEHKEKSGYIVNYEDSFVKNKMWRSKVHIREQIQNDEEIKKRLEEYKSRKNKNEEEKEI